MAVDERSRHELYLRLEAVVGQHEADTLMEMLPPVGWADVATKHDLEAFADRLRSEWRQALLEQTRTMVVANLTTMIALVSLTYAAVRLG